MRASSTSFASDAEYRHAPPVHRIKILSEVWHDAVDGLLREGKARAGMPASNLARRCVILTKIRKLSKERR